MINRARQLSNTKEPSNKKLHCIVFFVVLFVIYQICCFANGWLVNGDEYMGLWQLCSQRMGCLWMETSPSYDVLFLDWFASIRAFLLLTSIFTVLAIMFQVFNVYCDHTITMFPVRGCAILIALYLTLAIIIFPVMKPTSFDDIWELGWTYYVTCAACLFSYIQVFVTFKVGGKAPARGPVNRVYGGGTQVFQHDMEMQPQLFRNTDPTSAEAGAVGRDDWTITEKSEGYKEEALALPKKVDLGGSVSSYGSRKSSRSDSVSSKGSVSSSGSSSSDGSSLSSYSSGSDRKR